MKTVLMLFLSTVLYAQQERNVTFLDPNDKPLTEEEFLKFTQSNRSMIVKNDSLHIIKAITERSEHGRITNYDEIFDQLKSIYPDVKRDKPLVVIFYPGEDPCNTSDSSTKETRKLWFSELESNVYKVAQIKPFYLYRSKEGLKKYKGIIQWKKDPSGIIEKTFFHYHYPCSSYVVISPSGNYTSYFGEFMKEHVWEDLKDLME